MIVNLVGRTDLLDHTLVKYRNTVGKRKRLLLVMRYIDRCDAEIALHLLQFVSQLDTELRVQVTQRLVHTDDGGICHQCSCDCNTLLLSAGELGYSLCKLLIAQIHLLRNITNLLVNFFLLDFFNLQAKGYVVIHRHGREKCIALEYNSDVSVLDGNMCDVLAVCYNGTVRRLNETCQRPQCCRLSASGGTKECEKLSFLYMYIYVVQCGEISKFHCDIIESDHDQSPLFLYSCAIRLI